MVTPNGSGNTPSQSSEDTPGSFEAALQRWEEVVELLEHGSLTLEEALQLYEEGTRLRAICNARLSEAEGKIKVLRQIEEGPAGEGDWAP